MTKIATGSGGEKKKSKTATESQNLPRRQPSYLSKMLSQNVTPINLSIILGLVLVGNSFLFLAMFPIF
ncbi:unnamed protein product [Caenorhabditis sp. 36 PRJEB53466]|nr:unnamed protein product [Caenorhabditis sp. 36 PRJEB53466]